MALLEDQKAGRLELAFDAPIYLLLAHALELNLKALLLLHGTPMSAVEGARHDLIKLYDQLRAGEETSHRILKAEIENRLMWRSVFREARDEYRNTLMEFLDVDECPEEFGIYDNDMIGRNLPDLREIVCWLNTRHAKSGSEFRYFKSKADFIPFTNAFNLNENIVFKTVSHANSYFVSNFATVDL